MNYFIIEIIGSLLYFFQKVFLSLGKRIAWLLGFLGSIAFIVVTIHKGSFAYTILEVTSGIIFIFGFFAWKKFTNMQIKFTLLMSVITILGIVIVFILNTGSPNWFLENMMVIFFTIGATLLALKKPTGWILYIIGHLILILYAYILQTYSIMLLQITSLPFAVIGYRNLKKISVRDTLQQKLSIDMIYIPKKILFICKGNWFRSQMAAAIYNKLTNSDNADSVGTYVGASDEPEGHLLTDLFKTPYFFETMEKNGMNIRNNSTKRLQPSMIDEYDIIVSMAEEPYIPDFLKETKRVIWWDIENPTSIDQKIAEDTYEKIDKLVRELVVKSQ